MFSQQEKFKEILRGRKILLISSLAAEARAQLEKDWQDTIDFEVTGAIPIFENEEIPAVKEEIAKYDFDICFLAAGVNATILAPYVAQTYQKVAFDIGWGMKSLITGSVTTDSFITDVIGLESLFKL
jgi:hypothetical protein